MSSSKTSYHLNAFQHAIALTSRMGVSGTRSPTLVPPHAPISSFQDPDLYQTYQKFLSTSNIGPAGEDIERPSKRARLSIVNDQDTIRNVRSKILASIHMLLGSEGENRQGGLDQIPLYEILVRSMMEYSRY